MDRPDCQIEEVEGILEIRLDPFQLPEFHGGGGGDDSTNKIPIDSVYSRIAKRPALCDLPSVHSKDDAASFSFKALQETYMKILSWRLRFGLHVWKGYSFCWRWRRRRRDQYAC
jgi:hypothetical protein